MKKIILSFTIFYFFSNLYAQTSNDLKLDRMYWNYRELYKKYFTIIGKERGMSIVSDRLYHQMAVYTDPLKCNTIPNNTDVETTTESKTYWGYRNFGDATLDYDNYLGVLATEYWLLKHYNHDDEALNAIKNEIYFALYAIERLDNYGDFYYDNNSTNNLNGFFIRDDIPQDHMKNFRLYADGEYDWHSSNITSGLYHIKAIEIAGTMNYFGPDALKIRQSENVWDVNRKRVETEVGKGSEMSMDHLIGVFTGLKYLQTFVDWDLEVDPDGSSNNVLASKNIVTWTSEIADRIMSLITVTRNNIPFKDGELIDDEALKKCLKKNNCSSIADCPECDTEDEWGMYRDDNPRIMAKSANYLVVNPSQNNRLVWRGPFAFGFGYPLEVIGEQLANANRSLFKDYPSVSVNLTADNKYFAHIASVTYGAAFHLLSIPLSFIVYPGMEESAVLNTNKKLQEYMVACPGLSLLGGNGASQCLLGRPFQMTNPSWWRDLWNAIPEKELIKGLLARPDQTGNHMIIRLAAISGTWSHETYVDYCDYMGYELVDIVYALLNNKRPLKSKSYYEAKLIDTREFGIFDEPGHGPFNKNNALIQSTIFDVVDHKYHDIFNGNDFMLIYNLYRIADIKYWGTDQNKITYKEASNVYNLPKETFIIGDVLKKHHSFLGRFREFPYPTPTSSTEEQLYDYPTTIPYTEGSATYNTVNTSIAYDHSMNYGIRLPERLSHNLTLNNNGKIIVTYDLYVNGPNLILNSGSEIETTTPSTNETLTHILKIQKGCTLELKGGSIMRIANNTQLIIEDGAKIIYHPGARIILNGSNAILKIDEGQILLKSGAIFSIEGGNEGRGYVHFIKNWKPNDKPSIVCEDNTAKFILEGTYTEKYQYYNDKILQITGNIGLTTDWNLKHFIVKKGFIAMGKGSSILSNAEYTLFQKCNINVLSNVTQDLNNKHNGISIPGRLNSFNEVTINNCNIGIKFFNRGSQDILNLSNCTIVNAIEAVHQLGGGFKIENSQLYGRNFGINSTGISSSSILRYNEIGIDVPAGFRPGSSAMKVDGTRHLYATNNWVKKGAMGFNIMGMSARLRCNTMNENSINLRWLGSPLISILNGYNLFEAQARSHIVGNGDTYFGMKNGYNAFKVRDIQSQSLIFNVNFSSRSPYMQSPNMLDGGNNAYFGNILKDYTYGNDMNFKFDFTFGNAAPLQLYLFQTPDLTNDILYMRTEACLEENEFQPLSINSIEYPDIKKNTGIVQLMAPPDNTNMMTPIKISHALTIPIVNKPIGEVLNDNFRRLYIDSIVVFDSIIKELGNVLVGNDTSSALKTSPVNNVIYVLYSMYNEAYSSLAFKTTTDSSLNNFDKVEDYYLSVDSVFSRLYTSSFDSNSIWNLYRFEILNDWAQANRLANHKTKAIQIIDSGKVHIFDSTQIQSLNNWKCIFQLENLLQSDTTLSYDSAILLCPCVSAFNDEIQIDSVQSNDSMISYCDWSSKNIESYSLFEVDSNLQSIENIENPENIIALNDSGIYCLKKGNYKLTYFDTLNYTFRFLNLTVNADTPVVNLSDTSIHYCNWNDNGYPAFASFTPIDTFDYDIKDDSSARNVNIKRLVRGSYTLESYDINNCMLNKMKILVYADSVYANEIDTTINDYQFNTYISSFSNLNYQIYNSDRYILGPLYKCNNIGDYLIEIYDSANCSKEIINLSVIGDTIVIESFDSTVNIYYLQDTSSIIPQFEFYPMYSVPFLLVPSIIDSTNIEDYIYLTELDSLKLLDDGEYKITYYDTINCKKIIENLTVNIQPYVVSHSYDTLGYSCLNEYNYFIYEANEDGTMVDNDTNIIETIGSMQYVLDPQNGNYNFYVHDVITNYVHRTSISFIDLLAIPSECDNYLMGSYNRESGDGCCFVSISDIICDGDTAQIGDLIHIYDLDSVYLYSTEIDIYNSSILGFRFCPPHWNTDEGHINDWYRIVFKKSPCIVCRLDFMCDSLAFESSSYIGNNIKWKEINTLQSNEKSTIKYSSSTFHLINQEPTDSLCLINIYPNPASSVIKINITNYFDNDLNILIYDPTGKVVYTNEYQSKNSIIIEDLNLSFLYNGIYTIFIPELNYYYKLVIVK